MSPVPSTSAASRNRIEPSTSKATTPVGNSTAASIQKQPSNKPNADTNAFETQLLDNSYARELFFRHTNIKEVVAKKLPDRSENTRQKYAPQLYRLYVLEPEQRIREHLHEVRFDTRISEGLLRMALKVPLTSEHDWNAHKATLARAGIRKLCFVDMTQNNCVLEYQEKVVRKLKAEFRHWSAKLNKLSSYLTMYQRQREAEERKFLSLLKHHSSLKGSWTLQLPVVVKELLQERWLPSEKRINLIWSELRFYDDHLNRKYEVGSYSKFRFNMEVDPEVVVEPTSLAIDPDSFVADDQRCITPVNVTSNRPPAVVRVQQETVTEEDETQVNQEI
uniref:Uncharacterized protein n=1 Tax=Anopheles maculatus TaxID=74869 RepID=A0A182S7Q4_9DIPT